MFVFPLKFHLLIFSLTPSATPTFGYQTILTRFVFNLSSNLKCFPCHVFTGEHLAELACFVFLKVKNGQLEDTGVMSLREYGVTYSEKP